MQAATDGVAEVFRPGCISLDVSEPQIWSPNLEKPLAFKLS